MNNTSSAQDRRIAEAETAVPDLIDIIRELDEALTEANKTIETLESALANASNDA